MSNILTKADIQNFAPELDLSGYNDATISGMLSMAQSRAESFCSVAGFDLAVQTETDNAMISNFGDLTIVPRRRPIVSVSEIKLVKGQFSTTLVLADSSNNPYYQIEYPNTVLKFPNSYFYLTGTYLAGGASQLLTLRGAKVLYQMTYYGGYQEPPFDLKYAISLYFRDIVAKRNNPNGLQSFSQGSYSENYGSSKEGKSRIVLEAEDILMNGDYCRSVTW